MRKIKTRQQMLRWITDEFSSQEWLYLEDGKNFLIIRYDGKPERRNESILFSKESLKWYGEGYIYSFFGENIEERENDGFYIDFDNAWNYHIINSEEKDRILMLKKLEL